MQNFADDRRICMKLRDVASDILVGRIAEQR